MDDFQGQSDSITSIITSANYWLGFVSGVVGSFLVAISSNLLTNPKPIICGGGGGTLYIMNPSRLWVIGYNRNPIVITHAHLVDPANPNKNFGILTWNSSETRHDITLLPGKTASVHICGVNDGRVYSYKGKTPEDIESSETIMEGPGSKKMYLVISTLFNKSYKFPIEILLEEKRSAMFKWHLLVRQRLTFKTRLRDALFTFRDGFRILFKKG